MAPQQKKGKKQLLKFTIDCSIPVADNVIDPASFVSPVFINLQHPASLVSVLIEFSEGGLAISLCASLTCLYNL